MKINWKKLSRDVHFWGALLCAVPLLVVIITGMILILKKEFHWVQPTTIKREGRSPNITFMQILDVAKSVQEAGIEDWSDIDRLDVRPGKGIIKIRSANNWEIQIDHQTSEVVQVAYRRSDFIESLHAGTFWGKSVSYYIFLPSAFILFALLITGIYMFVVTYASKRNLKRRRKLAMKGSKNA